MPNHKSSKSALGFALPVGGVGVLGGACVGWLVGNQPLFPVALIAIVAIVVFFFKRFEHAVCGLLILRSALDVFSAQQLPALFAIGVDALTLLYLLAMLFTHREVKTDGFWWLFAGWVLIQGIWVILLPLGGLGLDGSALAGSIREWVRLFSWLMVYLLVMQLKDKVSPHYLIHTLFWSLLLPILVALFQMFLPSVLPDVLSAQGGVSNTLSEGVSRIRGTLGHPNTFVTFTLMFIGLTYWRFRQSKQWYWLALLGLLAFMYVSTKSLFGLMMLGTLIAVLIVPQLSLPSFFGGILLFGMVIVLFGSTEFGQERFGSIGQTPLLNPDIDIWKAILLSEGDNNSFNWRIAQWTYLLGQWSQYPILGFGLGLSADVSTNNLYPHNDYIRALVEGGIIGFTIFIGFFGIQMARLVQLSQQALPGSGQRGFCLILIAILLSLPVGMLTENIWSHTTFFFYWWTLLAVAGWDWSDSENSQEQDPPASVITHAME